MVAGMNRHQRVSALEQAGSEGAQALHCITRYEDETVEQAAEAHEVAHGPIGSGRNVLRVIISKPGERRNPGMLD